MRLPRYLPIVAGAVAGALMLAACGGSANTSDHIGGGHGGRVKTVTVTITQTTRSTTSTGPLTDTTTTSTTPGVKGAACTASDLTPVYLGSNGAAGTIVLGFALKNSGSSTCHTYGWPGVQFLSAAGARLPTGATRTSSDVAGSTPATALTLKPGEEASFRIVTSDMGPGGGACPTARALQIYAPDDTATMKLALNGVAACGKATLSPLMAGDSAFAGQGGGGQGGGSDGGGGAGQTGVGSGISSTGSGGAGV